MESLKELYKIGRGPSSSHTMGPERAIKILKERYKTTDEFKVTLLGSLASTGKGHGTDEVIKRTAHPLKCNVIFDEVTACPVHPNTMDIEVLVMGEVISKNRVYSVGGGSIKFEGEKSEDKKSIEIYSLNSFSEISKFCNEKKIRLWQYVEMCEGEEIFAYLEKVWKVMKEGIKCGLETFGKLPGILGTERRAKKLYEQSLTDESAQTKENRLVCSYAFAVSEHNASGGVIATAPTCGACGVLPSVLKYMQEIHGFSDKKILRALAVGGLVGNLIKKNASISGAECGCQAEIGSACSMTAAALGELFDMSIMQIEYAAEVAMEHHLGLTCDPIAGLVQIPCIERNAVAAMRAINAMSLATFLAESSKISFDTVVKAMYNTGKDLLSNYKETSHGGLAKYYEFKVTK